MNCREFLDFLMAYLDGELSDEERATFQQHMEACPPCVTYLETYGETVRLGGICRESEGALPEEVPDQLVAAILAARQQR